MATGGVEPLDRRADLDGLRGVAIILTIVLHYVARSGCFSYLGPEPIARLLHSFWSGVDIFFVLSGFLIGGIILDNARTAHFFRSFYLRRALRILPVALLAIAFGYLVMPALFSNLQLDGAAPAFTYVLFIDNFWTANSVPPYPPLAPLWSLAIEQQFYLVAPAFVLLAGERARNVTLLAIVLASPILRMCNLGVSPWDFTLLRLDGFAAGILVAVLVRDVRFAKSAAQARRTINNATITLVVTALAFGVVRGFTPAERLAFGISLNSLAAAGLLLVLHLNRGSWWSRTLSQPWLTATGRMSYFLYVMHWPILICVMARQGRGPLQPVLALGLSLAAAWLSWRFLESPLIALGRTAYRHRQVEKPVQTGASGAAII